MRHLTTNEEMFDAIVDHIYQAKSCSVSKPFITIFRASTPGKDDGPRIWNRQLIRYAGFKDKITGKVIGDPMETEFTEMLINYFPKITVNQFQKKDRFTKLPLVI